MKAAHGFLAPLSCCDAAELFHPKPAEKTLGLNVLFALSCFPQGNVSERRYSAASSISVDGDDGADCGLSPRTNTMGVYYLIFLKTFLT